jgi:hypothetical protein
MSDILTLLKERQSTGLLTCDIAVGQQKSLIASIKTIFRHIFRLARRRLLQCQKIGMECGGPPSRHTISKRTDPACLSKDHAEPIYGHGLILIVRKQLARKASFQVENEFCLTSVNALIYQHCVCKGLATLLCGENI